jgi:hypothetical protein
VLFPSFTNLSLPELNGIRVDFWSVVNDIGNVVILQANGFHVRGACGCVRFHTCPACARCQVQSNGGNVESSTEGVVIKVTAHRVSIANTVTHPDGIRGDRI